MPSTAVANPKFLDQINATLALAYERGFVMGDGDKRLPTFPSGMTRDAGLALSAIVRDERAATTLETGMALGLSTLWIVNALLSNSEATNIHHTAVDPFQATDWRRAALRLLTDAGDLIAQGLVTHLSEDSTLALPNLIIQNRRFDLILIDGGHLFELAFCDILFASRLIRPGGLIIVDDLWMPSVSTAVNYFTANSLLTRELRPDLEPSKRFALLRAPEQPPKRAWDHFVPFEVARGKGT